jgi:starch synthase
VPYLPDGSAVAVATGFAFENPHPEVLLSTVLLALRVYRDKEEWQGHIRRGMRQDNSWRNSAKQYVGLYELAMEVPQVILPT